jgi:S-adenosylmethionine hydrolase
MAVGAAHRIDPTAWRPACWIFRVDHPVPATASLKPRRACTRSHLRRRSDSLVSRILTLTTDFGLRDAYAAAMKGTILSINPSLRMVDITHQIHPQDIMEAAFVLRAAAPCFPPGTVHLVVVDPGVGTERTPVAVAHGGQFFVGPDNGLFSLVLDGTLPEAVVALDHPAYWRTPAPSTTFHGRDIFAPVAAHLAAGRSLAELGSERTALTPLHWALPIADDQGIQGWVVHVDHYGNCITNITATLFDERRRGRPMKCFAGSALLAEVRPTYASVAVGEPLALFGSTGFLEIAVHAGNASELLGIRKGAPVNIVFVDER